MFRIGKAQFKLLLLLTALVMGCNGLNTSSRNDGKPGSGDDTNETERFGDSTVQTGTYPVPINGLQLDASNIAGLDGLEKNGKVIFTPLMRIDGKLVPSTKLAPGSTAIYTLVDSPGFSIGAKGNCSINGHQLICLPGALAASGYSITARVVVKSTGMPDSKAFEKLINKAGYWQLVTRVGENGDLDFPPIPNILVGIGAPEGTDGVHEIFAAQTSLPRHGILRFEVKKGKVANHTFAQLESTSLIQAPKSGMIESLYDEKSEAVFLFGQENGLNFRIGMFKPKQEGAVWQYYDIDLSGVCASALIQWVTLRRLVSGKMLALTTCYSSPSGGSVGGIGGRYASMQFDPESRTWSQPVVLTANGNDLEASYEFLSYSEVTNKVYFAIRSVTHGARVRGCTIGAEGASDCRDVELSARWKKAFQVEAEETNFATLNEQQALFTVESNGQGVESWFVTFADLSSGQERPFSSKGTPPSPRKNSVLGYFPGASGAYLLVSGGKALGCYSSGQGQGGCPLLTDSYAYFFGSDLWVKLPDSPVGMSSSNTLGTKNLMTRAAGKNGGAYSYLPTGSNFNGVLNFFTPDR